MFHGQSLRRAVVGSVLLASLCLGAPAAWAAPPPPQIRLRLPLPPPIPLIERHSLPPGPNFVWIPGFHEWNGKIFVWVPGRWDRPPQRNAKWVPGVWKHDRRGWYFVKGHWR